MMTYESVQTVRDLVRDAAVLFPNKTFLRYIQNNSVTDETFEEFRKQTDAIASWITVQTSELGHKPKVAMMSANTPLYVKMLLGVMIP